MPLKRFWFYSRQVDRLAAEESLRMLNLLASATSGEAYSQTVEKLQQQMGQIYVSQPTAQSLAVVDENGLDPEFDKASLLALKAKLAPKRKVKGD